MYFLILVLLRENDIFALMEKDACNLKYHSGILKTEIFHRTSQWLLLYCMLEPAEIIPKNLSNSRDLKLLSNPPRCFFLAEPKVYFRIVPNIYNGKFCKIFTLQLSIVTYFWKAFHRTCLIEMLFPVVKWAV